MVIKVEELLNKARLALEAKDGRAALAAADAALDEDESCTLAWLIAMKSFQFIFPIDAYDVKNELSCGRQAIDTAAEDKKDAISTQVYRFYLTKITEVLERDAERLADARELLSFYQARAYLSSDAAEETRLKDKALLKAVRSSLNYCTELYDEIPLSALTGNPELNSMTRTCAEKWRDMANCLEMRLELYKSGLKRSEAEYFLSRYAGFLRPLPDREQILSKPLTFCVAYRDIDQLSYLK